MATGCPCGATPTDPDGLISYLTDELIEAAVDSAPKLNKFKALLAAFTLSAIHVEALCAGPRQQMPELALADFLNPATGWPKVAQALNSSLYPLLCTCTDCPPLTDCGTGFSITVGPENGWLPDPDEPRVVAFLIPNTVEIYAERSPGVCLGFKSGIQIIWHVDRSFDPDLGVAVCNYNFTGCNSWSADDYGQQVTLYFGSNPLPSTDPWPAVPPGIPDYPGPPSCSNDDICAMLARMQPILQQTQLLAQIIAGPVQGVTAPYLFTLPGLNTPIQGTLAETLPRALEALAPIQPAQLVDPEVVPVDTSSLVELDGQAYVSIALTTVPDYLSVKGSGDSAVYYEARRSANPGWVVVIGQTGVLGYYGLNYPSGVEFALPATATNLAVHLEAGVEIELTFYDRHV